MKKLLIILSIFLTALIIIAVMNPRKVTVTEFGTNKHLYKINYRENIIVNEVNDTIHFTDYELNRIIRNIKEIDRNY